VQADGESVRLMEYRDRTLVVRFEPRAVDSPVKRDALVARLAKSGLTAGFSDSVLSVRKGGGT
jgi:N-glycosylase/DNA lyase